MRRWLTQKTVAVLNPIRPRAERYRVNSVSRPILRHAQQFGARHPATAAAADLDVGNSGRMKRGRNVAPADLGRGPLGRAPCNPAVAEVIEEAEPAVVSFHFGLPDESLLARVRRTGAKIYSSATTVAEARWLEDHGVDAIIAQGAEAGGHRGMFLTEDIRGQPGLFALLPQVADAVRVPVIAAGGIADGRGIAAAFMLGAAAVQIGTAYLSTPQSTISAIHRPALRSARDDSNSAH